MSRVPHTVRIIAGRWRGRRIAFPADPAIRPTPDRVRETLFNWLREEVADARCLDLFAGSGALGLEALSRGARQCTFVDASAAAAAAIRDNLEILDGAGEVIEADVERWLREPGRGTSGLGPSREFDLVFLDPPFGQGRVPRVLALLAAGNWLSARAFVYVESERSAGEPALPPGWSLFRSKFAGEVGYHLARPGVPGRSHSPSTE